MDFVQRAKALLKSTAKSGALKILPLAAAAAMSMGTAKADASFNAGSAFTFCADGTLNASDTANIGGVTGLKLANASGSSCSVFGDAGAFMTLGASGSGLGDFPTNMTQLLIGYDFNATSQSNLFISWSLDVTINGFQQSTSGGTSGGQVTGTFNYELSDLGAPGATFSDWSVLLTVSTFDEIGDTLTVTVPENSIDIDGIRGNVEDVPEPATVGLMFAGGLAFLVRRRMMN